MRIEVETAEARGLSMPCRFHFDWRVIEVVEILDQWFGADHRLPTRLRAAPSCADRRKCLRHPRPTPPRGCEAPGGC